MTLKQLYKQSADILANVGIDSPEFDARAIIENVCGISRAEFIANGESEVAQNIADTVLQLVARRATREPLQYVIGEWEFMGLKLKVRQGVLIPRDDTEVVTNAVLQFLKNRPASEIENNPQILELCAGSGAIALAVNANFKNAKITAIEKSPQAFAFLEENTAAHNANITLVQADIFTCHSNFADASFDVVVSNPPYIKDEELPLLQPEVQKEPQIALNGGVDGYDFYRCIADFWCSKLKNGGLLALELGEGQFEYTSELLQNIGTATSKLTQITAHYDLQGTKRALTAVLQKHC
ncbi:MAG: peptide chain release factor N(5)-glutamine methyltransferase [Oscillospiraceae bacterium]|jgi:release factor glutamine methyltransferase|nr:peptide chain release factor N(5)-glutamine methyltransferase [Oscillospiraceae bacterium]